MSKPGVHPSSNIPCPGQWLKHDTRHRTAVRGMSDGLYSGPSKMPDLSVQTYERPDRDHRGRCAVGTCVIVFNEISWSACWNTPMLYRGYWVPNLRCPLPLASLTSDSKVLQCRSLFAVPPSSNLHYFASETRSESPTSAASRKIPTSPKSRTLVPLIVQPRCLPVSQPSRSILCCLLTEDCRKAREGSI